MLLLVLLAPLFLFLYTLMEALPTSSPGRQIEENDQSIVSLLGLTDLALFTEARYTRHLSLADRHSAFQDHPLALEHFPTGSLIPPPTHLKR